VLLVIDQLSGGIRGELREGPHQGQPLDQVSTEDLKDLLARWYHTDVASAEALEVYLERERQQTVSRPRHAQRPETQHPTQAHRMASEEARAVLGLAPEAGPEDVRSAHKRLMQRLHPDRGGSDYLATKINEAKDVLLG
jgi:CysZ protein